MKNLGSSGHVKCASAAQPLCMSPLAGVWSMVFAVSATGLRVPVAVLKTAEVCLSVLRLYNFCGACE